MSIQTGMHYTVQREAMQRCQRGAHPLFNVLGWELRRRFERLWTWVLFVAVFCIFLLLTWVGRGKGPFFGNGIWTDEVTPLGLMSELVGVQIPIFSLLVPFISTDLLASDLRRRTHELLMTTALPTWAYVWGRYLAGLVFLILLLFVMLASILIMGWLLHTNLPLDQNMDVPGYAELGYPAPNVAALLTIWLLITFPLVFLLYNLSFALGTLLPNATNALKACLVIATLACWMFAPVIFQRNLAVWEPTGLALSNVSSTQAQQRFQERVKGEQVRADDVKRRLQIVRSLEQEIPDTSSWLLPRFIYITASGLIVVAVASRFQRFRNHLAL